jgi:hypothetical protein
MRSTLALGFVALLLPACLVGTGDITGTGGDDTGGGGGGGAGGGGGEGSGEGGGNNTPTPRVTGSVDKTTVSTELGKTEMLTLTITSEDGFSGPVEINPSVVADLTPVTDWTLTATPPSVTLAAGESQTVQLAVKIPTNTASLTPTLNIDLGSSAEAFAMTSAFTVANQYTIEIAAGTGTGAHSSLPNPNAPIKLRTGAKLVFHNGDTVQHVIHSDGMGFPHENTGAGQAGTDYIVTPRQSGTWYCHNHEGGGLARPVLVQ